MRPKSDYKNILICTVGGSPAVITETIWELLDREPAWIPDEIHFMTTLYGKGEAEKNNILDKVKEIFVKKGCKPVIPTWVIPKDIDGNQVYDSHGNDQEQILYADKITKLIKKCTFDRKDTEVYLSKAGGTKDHSSVAQDAMTIFARPRDKILHVQAFVKEGDNWKKILFSPDFFYLGQDKKEVIYGIQGRKGKKTAKIENIDVKVSNTIFIRHYLGKKQINDAFSSKNISYKAVMDTVQDNINKKKLKIDISSRTISMGEESCVLPNLAFALYQFLVESIRWGWKGAGSDGLGQNHVGWTNYDLMLNEKFDKLLELYSGGFTSEDNQRIEDLQILHDLMNHGWSYKESENKNPIHFMKYHTFDFDKGTQNEVHRIVKDIESEENLKEIAREKLKSKLTAAKSKIDDTIKANINNVKIRHLLRLHSKRKGGRRFGLCLDWDDIEE